MTSSSLLVLVLSFAPIVLGSTTTTNVVEVETPLVMISGHGSDAKVEDCESALKVPGYKDMTPLEAAKEFLFDCIKTELPKYPRKPNHYVLNDSKKNNFKVNPTIVEAEKRDLSIYDDNTDNQGHDNTDERRLNVCYGTCLDPAQCEFCCCTVGCTNVCYGCQWAWCQSRRHLRGQFETDVMNVAAAADFGDKLQQQQTDRRMEEEDDDVNSWISRVCKDKLLDFIVTELMTNKVPIGGVNPDEDDQKVGPNKCFGTKPEEIVVKIQVI